MKLDAIGYTIVTARWHKISNRPADTLEITASDASQTHTFQMLLYLTPQIPLSQEIINAIVAGNGREAQYLSKLFSAIYTINKQEIHEKADEITRIPI
jgi:hypothetical protein